MRERGKTPSSAAPLHWGSSAQLRCPRLSRGSRPRGKYLAPGGERGESAGGRLEADRSGRKGKTALAERRARLPGRSLQKARLHPSRPSGLRKYSGDWSGTEATGGLPFPEGSAGLRLLLPAIPARQAFPLSPPPRLLPPRAKLQFPGGFAQSGLEVGSLEVTRATRAGGVSSERRGAGRRGRGARRAGSRDAQVCGFGCRGGLTRGWRGIDVPSDPEGQRGLETRRTAGYGHRLWGAAALGLAPSGPHWTCARMAQLSRRATQHCMEEHGVGVG